MHAIRCFAVAMLMFAGCSSDAIEEDPIAEPELTDQEVSALPEDVADAHEHSSLVEALPDDTSAFDDDFVVPPYDSEVDETGAGGDRAGNFAMLMPAHAVGDDPDADVGICIVGVFIVLATQAYVRAVAEFDHARSTSLFWRSR